MHGSTQKIYNVVKDSPAGSTWGIATEAKFVKRISEEFPDRTIIPLRTSYCGNMSKINMKNLAESLNSIECYEQGEGNLKYSVNVDDEYRNNALKALDMMIKIVEEQ